MFKGKKTLAAAYISMLLTEIGYGNMIILLPLYLTDELKFSVSAVGFIVAMYSVAEFLLKTPSGWLADRWGRKPVFFWSIFLVLISFLLIEFASSFWLLLFLVMLGGAGVAAIWPINVVITADLVPEEKRGHYLGIISMICLTGKGIAPAIGSLAIYLTHSYHSLFLCNAVLCGLALLLVFWGMKEPERVSRQKSGGVKKLLFNYPRLWVLTIILFLQSLSIGILVPIAGLYANRVLGIDVEMIGPVLLLPVILIALMNYFTGLLSDKIGRKKPLLWGFIFMTVAFYLFPFKTSAWYLILVNGLLGLGYALMMPAWTALVTEESPPEQRGTVLGLVGTMQVLGLAIGPILGTQLWDRLGTGAPFWGGGFILTLGTAVAFWKIRGKE